jgi:hypothetical protein
MSAIAGLLLFTGVCCVLQWTWFEQNVARAGRRPVR